MPKGTLCMPYRRCYRGGLATPQVFEDGSAIAAWQDANAILPDSATLEEMAALRHTFAFSAEKKGCPREDLRKTLGHTCLALTPRYILRNPDRRNPAGDFAPPFRG